MSKPRTSDYRRAYYVAYDRALNQWKVAFGGAAIAYSAHSTKEEAMKIGREVAQKKQPARLVIHRLDGSIQEQYAYG